MSEGQAGRRGRGGRFFESQEAVLGSSLEGLKDEGEVGWREEGRGFDSVLPGEALEDSSEFLQGDLEEKGISQTQECLVLLLDLGETAGIDPKQHRQHWDWLDDQLPFPQKQSQHCCKQGEEIFFQSNPSPSPQAKLPPLIFSCPLLELEVR